MGMKYGSGWANHSTQSNVIPRRISMTTFDFTDLQLFITGPTQLRSEVRQAGTLPEFGHRDSESIKRFGPIWSHLKTLAEAPKDYEVILINGSGTTAMEASIRSLVAEDETVLNVSVGAFGDLYHTIAKANGKRAHLLSFRPGQAIDLGRLKQTIAEFKPAVVTLTHNETSTGVKNDIVSACALIHDSGAMALVDGVSLFGGANIDLAQAKPAMYITSTQKSLGLTAGFGIGFINSQAIEKAQSVKNRGYTSDILAHLKLAAKNQTLSTPNTTLANQMAVQLEYIVRTEGLSARFARHQALRDQTLAWVDQLKNYTAFAQDGYRSPTVTAVQAPQGKTIGDLKAIKEAMRQRGFLFDPGYGKLNQTLVDNNQPPIFRIGHMGDISSKQLERYLHELAIELQRLE